MKRFFDILVTFPFLLLAIPATIIIAGLIKWEDGGPILYRGLRIGRNGIPFYIMKFRTMVQNADKLGGPSTAADDPRITKIGNFLRRYKLDEFPQFFNVLKGDMSLVGPRPEVKCYTDLFTDEEKIILSVRPGITDWASIWNAHEGEVLAGAADPEQAYLELIRPTKLKLQMKYVKEKNFFLDLRIIFLTLLAVINRHSPAVREIRKIV